MLQNMRRAITETLPGFQKYCQTTAWDQLTTIVSKCMAVKRTQFLNEGADLIYAWDAVNNTRLLHAGMLCHAMWATLRCAMTWW